MDPFILGRKIVKGNSLRSTLPLEVLKHLHVRQGDEVEFVLKADGTVSIRKQNKVVLPDDIDSDFVTAATRVVEKYDRAIDALARK